MFSPMGSTCWCFLSMGSSWFIEKNISTAGIWAVDPPLGHHWWERESAVGGFWLVQQGAPMSRMSRWWVMRMADDVESVLERCRQISWVMMIEVFRKMSQFVPAMRIATRVGFSDVCARLVLPVGLTHNSVKSTYINFQKLQILSLQTDFIFLPRTSISFWPRKTHASSGSWSTCRNRCFRNTSKTGCRSGSSLDFCAVFGRENWRVLHNSMEHVGNMHTIFACRKWGCCIVFWESVCMINSGECVLPGRIHLYNMCTSEKITNIKGNGWWNFDHSYHFLMDATS